MRFKEGEKAILAVVKSIGNARYRHTVCTVVQVIPEDSFLKRNVDYGITLHDGARLAVSDYQLRKLNPTPEPAAMRRGKIN